VYVATQLWKGAYTATYLARATTPGTFVRPPAHAEEMYNPAVFGESDGGVFTVLTR
jgi:alpha-2-macroglobulin